MLLAALGLAPAAATLASAGCAAPAPQEAPAEGLRVPLASLPAGVHVRMTMGDRPVDLLRTDAGVIARSLWCTHMGCEVTWDESASRYRCPCHGGEFDAQGEPAGGPPKTALRRLVTRVAGDAVEVLPPAGSTS